MKQLKFVGKWTVFEYSCRPAERDLRGARRRSCLIGAVPQDTPRRNGLVGVDENGWMRIPRGFLFVSKGVDGVLARGHPGWVNSTEERTQESNRRTLGDES
jgi:hypothetical protein